MLEIFIFLQKKINLARNTQHAVITHVNTEWYKNPNFFQKKKKKLGDDVILVSAPLRHKHCVTSTPFEKKNIFVLLLL